MSLVRALVERDDRAMIARSICLMVEPKPVRRSAVEAIAAASNQGEIQTDSRFCIRQKPAICEQFFVMKAIVEVFLLDARGRKVGRSSSYVLQTP
jgi:hypothetical protein